MEQTGISVPTWIHLMFWGPALIQLIAVLVFILKLAPTWKEIWLERIQVRREEAAALTALAQAVTTISQSAESIAVEQRKATETVKILQRMNADSADHLTQVVTVLADRVDRLEERSRNNDQQETNRTRAN